MPIFARLIYGLVSIASRRGISDAGVEIRSADVPDAGARRKHRARILGIRGETFAYWYLRRHGYVIIATNYSVPGLKGEVDLIGYDGEVLAFVEVKTRGGDDGVLPEDAVNAEKRRNVSRMARRFLREFGRGRPVYRFDILAIESREGLRPVVRLHKDAFAEQ
jgi:putative endonuclease